MWFAIVIIINSVWALLCLPLLCGRERDPARAVMWLLIILLLPFVGTLLYILAGYTRPHRGLRRAVRGSYPLQTLIASSCGLTVARNNRIELLRNGGEVFASLIRELQHATHSIHLEYYILRDDRVGQSVIDILCRKARAGVEVRVIVDAIGSCALRRRAVVQMRASGVELRRFNAITFPFFMPHVTRRNHRKIVVVDGETAFMGGINIAAYYLDGDELGRWRDEHLRLEGDVVADLQRIFCADWRAAGAPALNLRHYVARHNITSIAPMQIAYAEQGVTRETLTDAFVSAIVSAQRSIRISSPYFIPPTVILTALRIAVKRGVDVEVMIPQRSSSRILDAVADSYVDDIFDTGAQIYRYRDGFLHAKMLIADDVVASVGTANMDYRSLEDNMEVTAFIYDATTVATLVDTFESDKDACIKLERRDWARRSWIRRRAEEVSRVIAPLL